MILLSLHGILEAWLSAYIYVPFIFVYIYRCNTMGLIVKFVKGKSICARFFSYFSCRLEA